MELLQKLKKDNIQAMRDKDSIKKGVLTLVISAISLAEKEEKRELSLNEEYTFIQKELKQTKDSLNQTPQDRVQMIEDTKRKISILESYLPKQLSKEEITIIIQDLMEKENIEPIKKNQGIIMKNILLNYKGQVDGKIVNEALSSLLK
ncbi:MAG: GatB/YqeY domain-containing protein [Erysipelotrichaceae bacterium]|nr:GatB/YqeY domain-containing protein [Erysipelotrichaceae bacterium]